MEILSQEIREEVALLMNLIKLELQDELVNQGHGVKGRSRLIDSMEVEIKEFATLLIAGLYAEDYWVFINYGVKASRVPFKRGSKAKSSKYIDALIKFFQKKGLTLQRAKRASFATATKAKKEGHPTRGSFRFSKNGRRKGFADHVLRNLETTFFGRLEKRIEDKAVLAFNGVIDNIQKRFEEI